MSLFVLSDDLRVLAKNIKGKFTHNFSDLNLDKIVFIKELESPSKSKIATTKVIGKLEKVVYGQHDYIIVIYDKRWQELTPAQKNLVLMKEMYKCKWDGDGLRKYDFNTFFELSDFGNFEDNPLVKDPMQISQDPKQD